TRPRAAATRPRRAPPTADRSAGSGLIAAAGPALAVPCQSTRAGISADPQPPRQPQQADQRLGILALADRLIQALQRPRDDLDALLLAAVSACREEVGRAKQMHALVAGAGTRVVGENRLPRARAAPDLLGQLAPRRLLGRLSRHVQAPRRYLA